MVAQRQYHLRYSMGDNPLEQKFLNEGEYILGRSPDCDIQLSGSNISRRHARLGLSASGCWVMDLGSSNGTYLEGQLLTENVKTPLEPGQTIKIDDYILVMDLYEAAQPADIWGDTTAASDSEEDKPSTMEKVQAGSLWPSEDELGTAVNLGDMLPPSGEQTGPSQPPQPQPPQEEAPTRVDSSAPLAIKLVIKDSLSGESKTRDLVVGEYVIGRVSSSDIVLQDDNVSRRHALMEITESGNWITDEGSANGTKVGDHSIKAKTRTPLSYGQEVIIGLNILRLEPPPGWQPEVAPAAQDEVGTRVNVGQDLASVDDSTRKDSDDLRTFAGQDLEAATRVDAEQKETPAVAQFDQDERTRIDAGYSLEAALADQQRPAVPSQYILKMRGPTGEWQQMPLSDGEYIIGRVSSCDIVLRDINVSRRHARLTIEGKHIWLMDLGSANGTQVASDPLSPRRKEALPVGQVFTIASFELLVDRAEEDIATSVDMAPAIDMASTRVSEPAASATLPSMGAGLRLRYRRGSGSWVEMPLSEGQSDIGRDPAAEISLDSKSVSRRHARLTVMGNQVWVTDLGSKNGVLKGGNLLSPNQKTGLAMGESFQIDEFTFEVSSPQQQQAAAAATAAAIPSYSGGAAGSTMIGVGPMAMPMEVESQAGRPLNLMGHERITIGREPDNHIILDHPLVSRYHAVIERMGKRTRLIDLHSSNGVYVNDKLVKESWLNSGDTLKIGPYQIKFTGNELRPSAIQSYTINVMGINKWVTKDLNLLQDINLYVGQNEFVALVGMSGAGKSTLMDAINGFRPATHGQVLISGTDLYQNYSMFRDEIGNVPQKDIVHMELTAEQALDYAAQLRMPPDTSAAERKQRVAETLDDLGLTFRKDVPIHKLSGGQLKRVSIGVELLTKPRLFFLDEPTSGLDPGTEYEMMKLLRRLADQGRTVMLITHATKNVMLCDKVIIITKGGNLAFYGPPEYALEYFDQYRTQRERLEKDMEFDDIYRILTDENRGRPEEWRERYLRSKFARYTVSGGTQAFQQQAGYTSTQVSGAAAAAAPARGQKGKRISSLRQFFILSARNLKIMVQDKISLSLTLALAPVLGLMNFIWGRRLFDPVLGDAAKVMAMFFIMSIIAVLVGAMGSVREIVKENEIYKRERAVGLKIMPYVLSKFWIGAALAIYQGVVLLIFMLILVNPSVPGITGYVSLLVTLILGVVCGYLLGLTVSSAAPNQNAAQLILIAMLVPQFLFAGVLMPLDRIPAGEIISPVISSRWTFEAFVRATGIGDPLVNDACWNLPKDERIALTGAQKEECFCMGPNLFINCSGIPGIYDKDYYTEDAQIALGLPAPEEPEEPNLPPTPTARNTPTLYPTPTYYTEPTRFPTPSPVPTFTPLPFSLHYDEEAVTGGDYSTEYSEEREQRAQSYVQGRILQYQKDSEEQMKEYQATREAQFEEYANDTEAQYRDYADEVQGQFTDYQATVEVQADEFANEERQGIENYSDDAYGTFSGFVEEMEVYGDDLSDWQTKREKAVGAAEAILGVVYDDYGRAFHGTVFSRWFVIGIISFVEFIMILFFQKRKDIV